MREKMQWSKNKLIDMEDIAMDLTQLDFLVNKFSNLIIPKKEEQKSVLSLLEARTFFESCLTIIKGIIEPNDNPLIEKINEKYYTHDALGKYFDIFLTILDYEQKILQDYVTESRKLISPIIIQVAITAFREKLIDYMGNIIVSPLYNAVMEYENNLSNLEKEKIDKKKSFEYMLFRQVFISAKMKGSQDRQKAIMSGRNMGSTFKETNITKIGSGKDNTQDINEVQIPPSLESFKDPFILDENEEEEYV
ncbi:MAG: hypothetical protein AABY22_23405 [Nanoarchaeota archaeon]